MVIFTRLLRLYRAVGESRAGLTTYGATAGGCAIGPHLRLGAALLSRDAAPSQSSAVPVRVEQKAWRLRGAQRRELGFRRSHAGRARGHAYRRAVPFFVRRQAARRRRSGGLPNLRERPRAAYGRYHRAHSAPRRAAGYRGANGYGSSARRFRDRAGTPGRSRGRGPSGSAAGRRGAAADRMGALLGRCRAVHRAGARSGAGRGWRALAQQPGCIRRRVRYGCLRESARLQHAGARPSARGKRHTHHRVPEPGATGGGATIYFSIRGYPAENPRRHRIAHPPAGHRMTTPPDFAPVREGEQIDAQALAAYLRGKLEGVEAGLTVRQFPGGHSNLTYLLEAGGREYVLRRPPLGPVAPKAHDMAREYSVLAAVHPFFPQTPRVFLLCEDPAVIGAIFFVMERRRGLVLRREIPAAYADDPGFGGRVSEAFVDCLAALHAVDVNRVMLGKPDGFLERQVKGWAERFERAQTETLPQMDQLIGWLRDRLPESPAPTLEHNDYKLDNLMLDAADPHRVEAVLDWEMATVGDPLVDLGCVMCYWPEAGDPPVRRDALSAITTLPGWYTRQQLVERYARITGRDVSGLGYYEVFGIFKIAVVLQQIYFRYHRGQTRDERFRNFDERVRGLVEIAAAVAER